MKKNLTELVFILDKSGSMYNLATDTIGGYNSLLEKQRKVEGECTITTVLFSDQYALLHDRIDIRAIRPITDKEYSTGGMTALYDAVGRTLSKIENAQVHTAEDYRAEKVMVVIITDGYENASREYDAAQVKSLIERQKEKGWEFIFLGANIDSVSTAANIGISADRAVDYVPDKQGTELNYDAMSRAVSSYRCCRAVDTEALDDIRRDKCTRG